MNAYFFHARTRGIQAGQIMILSYLNQEMKKQLKDQDVAELRVEAKRKAKYLGSIIQSISYQEGLKRVK